MTLEEFCHFHWSYYLMLEKDFLNIEKYISFDFGDNYLYDSNQTINDYGNSMTFSIELVKQYQTICSEIDAILKSICKELNHNEKQLNIRNYGQILLSKVLWKNLPNQKVRLNNIELQPFKNWRLKPNYNSPDWWIAYNNVKHNRLLNYKNANLKNVTNSLAGLYTLELYFAKFIADKEIDKDSPDVPNDISNLFTLIDFKTRATVVGHDSYLILDSEIDETCK